MLLQNCGILKIFYLCSFLAEAPIIFAEKKRMREQIRQQIETARQRLIKQRRLSRMKDFKKLREQVYDLAKRRFGEISEEVDQRLNLELEAIRINRRTLMLNTIALVLSELEKESIYCERTQQTGYNVSLVCYLLGISLFNPMDYPELITERYVIRAMGSLSRMTFTVESNILEKLKGILDRHGLKDVCSTEHSYLKQIEGTCYDTYLVDYNLADAESSSFEIYIRYSEHKTLDRKILNQVGIAKYEGIPENDSLTWEMIHDLDLFGTSRHLTMTNYEAIRQIRPRSISELAEALSFEQDKQYSLLQEYLQNKHTDATTYTGDAVIDEILSHTYGVLLYSRQQEAYMKRLNELSCSEKQAYDRCNEYLNSQLSLSVISNKCDKYVKAANLYRLAYIKTHYPEAFQKVIESNTYLK